MVCPYSWSRPGGVQTHVGDLAKQLRTSGHWVEILAPADGPVNETGFIGLGRSIPIPDNGSIQRVALSPMAILRTRRLVRSGRYDLVHLHEPMIPAVCLTALLSSRVPVVGTFHMVGSAKWYRLFRPLVTRANKRLNARICVSETARRFVSEVIPGNYRLIEHGVNLPQVVKKPRSGTRLVFVGRPEPRKGLDVLLEVFAGLPGNTKLSLVGVSPSEIVVPKRVTAYGRVSDSMRQKILNSADILCVPSLSGESFGLVLLEGMASGMPVVASDLPGYRDVLTPDCGRLTPPGDAAALRQVLTELLSDRELRARLGAAGRKAAAHYDWHHVLPKIVTVYEQVL